MEDGKSRKYSILAGCSKRPSSKAAGESKPEAYPLGRTVRRIRSTTSVRGRSESKPEAYPLGTLRISMSRERSWRAFSAAC